MNSIKIITLNEEPVYHESDLSTWPLENLEKKRKGIKRRINKKLKKGIDTTEWDNEYERYSEQILKLTQV